MVSNSGESFSHVFASSEARSPPNGDSGDHFFHPFRSEMILQVFSWRLWRSKWGHSLHGYYFVSSSCLSCQYPHVRGTGYQPFRIWTTRVYPREAISLEELSVWMCMWKYVFFKGLRDPEYWLVFFFNASRTHILYHYVLSPKSNNILFIIHYYHNVELSTIQPVPMIIVICQTLSKYPSCLFESTTMTYMAITYV